MPVSLRKLLLALALIVFTSVALVACAAKSTTASQPLEVDVTLSDMKIESSLTTFSTGVQYHFVVTNTGKVNHEFMIMPPVEPGTMSMTEMDKMALAMIEEDDLPPGATETLDYTFTKSAPAGTLEFACHLKGHYEAGMKLPIVVQ